MIASAWTDWLGAIGNLIMAGTAVVAVWVGLRKVDAWRREARGRDEYGYASRILQAVYGLRDAISAFRLRRAPGIEDFHRIRDAQSAVTLVTTESEALFGKLLDNAKELMIKCLYDLSDASVARDRMIGVRSEEERAAILDETRDPESNPFSGRVAEAVTAFEDALKPKLKG